MKTRKLISGRVLHSVSNESTLKLITYSKLQEFVSQLSKRMHPRVAGKKIKIGKLQDYGSNQETWLSNKTQNLLIASSNP
jgi:hypothetical protein